MEEIIKKDELLLDLIALKDIEIASKILTTNGALMWFSAVMTDWANHWESPNMVASLYEKRFAQFNALIKLAVGRLLLRDVEILKQNLTSSEVMNDESRLNILNEQRPRLPHRIFCFPVLRLQRTAPPLSPKECPALGNLFRLWFYG